MTNPAFSKRAVLAFIICVIAFSAFLLISNHALLSRSQTGSFEYFRRGEELLDKGRYRDAIANFARARDMSPDNETIRSGLVYAYSKYGAVLAEEKEYGRAIENLVKAGEIGRDPAVMTNLALIFSKRAVSRLVNGDWAGAVGDFSDSRMAASGSEKAMEALAVSLFNDAVLEYKSGRNNIAALCLKESLLVREEKAAFELLGDIYYRERDLDRAVFYWDKAKGLDSEDKGLIEKLERVIKERELAASQTALQLPHFAIRYEKGLDVDAAAVSEALNSAYLDVGRSLMYFPDSRTSVFFYSQKNFRDLFKQPEGVRALYDGNIRIPLPEKPMGRDELERYIYHEYAHAVVSAKTNNNCPVWLNEGIAVWQELKGRELPLLPVSGNSGASLNALEKAFDAPYYILAYTAVRFILDNWGPDSLNGILRRIASGQHAVNAIDDELLVSEREFDARWQNYLRKDYDRMGSGVRVK